MEYEMLKNAGIKIVLSGEGKARILKNCKEQMTKTMEEHTLKNNRNTFLARKPAAVFAAVAICLSLAVTAMAAPDTVQGFFRDITDWRGAVVGTSYEQATDEIGITAEAGVETLYISVSFISPKKAPYRSCENLSIGSYRIVDGDGAVVAEGTDTAMFPVHHGRTVIEIPLSNLKAGSYCLHISAFASHKKADQPLTIIGNWECAFEK